VIIGVRQRGTARTPSRGLVGLGRQSACRRLLLRRKVKPLYKGIHIAVVEDFLLVPTSLSITMVYSGLSVSAFEPLL
jgi:hypothetical protein